MRQCVGNKNEACIAIYASFKHVQLSSYLASYFCHNIDIFTECVFVRLVQTADTDTVLGRRQAE